MIKKQTVIYGLGGADVKYKAISYFIFFKGRPSIDMIRERACAMAEGNPSIKELWVLDTRPELKDDYLKSFKGDSIENCYIFKDLITRSGIRILL